MTTAVLFTTGEIRQASSIRKAAEMIKHNFEVCDESLIRGLLLIYARQTADEQASETTKLDNGKGFTGVDAEILTSFAKQVERHIATPKDQRRFATPLSPRGQMPILRRKMKKYATQLATVVRGTKTFQPTT